MPLDADAQAVMDMLISAPPLGSLAPEAARAQMAAAPRPEPEAVASITDIAVPSPDGDVPVRLYRPAGASDGPLPVVVFFHGGGWVIGSIESHDGTCRVVANRSGCLVASVEYRLAPEHRFPAAPEDCYAATAWIAEHAAELGGDPSRVAVAGDSAGGNLAAVVALMARDRGGPSLRFQLLIYPVTDFDRENESMLRNGTDFYLTQDAMRWFDEHYVPDVADRSNPYAAPLRAHDLSGLPPALVITAEYDPLCDEGEAYAKRLADAGVAATASRYDGVFHGFFSMSLTVAKGRAAVDEASAALRAALA